MPRKPRELPQFRSEEEEIRFWDEHHPADYFTELAPDVIIELKRSRKKMVSVRIDEGLQADLKAIAAEHGIPYQRLMRELLRGAVVNLRRRETSNAAKPRV
jgi:predicted DNA binding CopG/RHH family protein